MGGVTLVKDLLQRYVKSSCFWGHTWSTWEKVRPEPLEAGPFKRALVQYRNCLVCNFEVIKVQTIDIYDGK